MATELSVHYIGRLNAVLFPLSIADCSGYTDSCERKLLVSQLRLKLIELFSSVEKVFDW